ncbi:MAG: TPM domain-containing protein [Chloroflexota bacterium]
MLRRPLFARLGLSIAASAVALFALAPALIAAGPPFPNPVDGQQVYDTAKVLDQATIARTQQRIGDIKRATGAEIAVYTQLVPGWTTTDDVPGSQALALMNQWGGPPGLRRRHRHPLRHVRGQHVPRAGVLYGGSHRGLRLGGRPPGHLRERDAARAKLCDMSAALDAAMAKSSRSPRPSTLRSCRRPASSMRWLTSVGPA